MGIDRRKLLVWSGFAIATSATLALARRQVTGSRDDEAAELAPYGAFCMPPPDAALLAPSQKIDAQFVVNVPTQPPAIALLSESQDLRVAQNKAIEYVVHSTREGALAVHGLSELVLVRASETARVRFRAIYSGRFPLHFHGPDGSHFEISALQIVQDASGWLAG